MRNGGHVSGLLAFLARRGLRNSPFLRNTNITSECMMIFIWYWISAPHSRPVIAVHGLSPGQFLCKRCSQAGTCTCSLEATFLVCCYHFYHRKIIPCSRFNVAWSRGESIDVCNWYDPFVTFYFILPKIYYGIGKRCGRKQKERGKWVTKKWRRDLRPWSLCNRKGFLSVLTNVSSYEKTVYLYIYIIRC